MTQRSIDQMDDFQRLGDSNTYRRADRQSAPQTAEMSRWQEFKENKLFFFLLFAISFVGTFLILVTFVG